MGNNDASMRVNFSLRQIKRLSFEVRRDVSDRTIENVVMTGENRLSYGGVKTLVSQRHLMSPSGDVERLQKAFADSRAHLYKRVIAWFDDMPCNCGETDND